MELFQQLHTAGQTDRRLPNKCGAAVSGIKTAVVRDAELLLSNMVAPICVDDYIVCGMFLYV